MLTRLWAKRSAPLILWTLLPLTILLVTYAAQGEKQAPGDLGVLRLGKIGSDGLYQFPDKLQPGISYDVREPVPGKNLLQNDKTIPQAQRIFDIFAWQQFIALNWPAKPDGEPDLAKNLADSDIEAPRVWESWVNIAQIFKPHGERPDPWSAMKNEEFEKTQGVGMRKKAAWRQNTNLADENLQAFSGPLVDQNGKWLHYQVMLNKEEFDYIVKNELYNLEGQVEFSKTREVSFPMGDAGKRKRGAIELKFAWKELQPGDPRNARFFMRKVHVKSNTTGAIEDRLLGLVGMHISVRTKSAPEWIWATFEHVDNAPTFVEGDSTIQVDSSKTYNFYNKALPVKSPLPPSSSNPNLPAIASTLPAGINKLPDKTGFQVLGLPGLPSYGPITPDSSSNANNWIESATTTPVQTVQIVPKISQPFYDEAEKLNASVQALLRAQGSVFQYYKLISTQWPVHPLAPAFAGGNNSAPESIQFKTPGNMVPVFLTNTTMETYFQIGNQYAGALEQDDRLAANSPPIDTTPIFGTESCVGCHYSSGICVGFRYDSAHKIKEAIKGENNHGGRTGNANFSWILQLEAYPKGEIAAVARTRPPSRSAAHSSSARRTAQHHADGKRKRAVRECPGF